MNTNENQNASAGVTAAGVVSSPLLGSVPLPAEISPSGVELWDWAGKLGDALQRQARLNALRAELRACGTLCGDCEKWMKSRECPRERPGTGKRAGFSVGPSMNDRICGEYVEKLDTTQRRARYEAEMASLSA